MTGVLLFMAPKLSSPLKVDDWIRDTGSLKLRRVSKITPEYILTYEGDAFYHDEIIKVLPYIVTYNIKNSYVLFTHVEYKMSDPFRTNSVKGEYIFSNNKSIVKKKVFTILLGPNDIDPKMMDLIDKKSLEDGDYIFWNSDSSDKGTVWVHSYSDSSEEWKI